MSQLLSDHHWLCCVADSGLTLPSPHRDTRPRNTCSRPVTHETHPPRGRQMTQRLHTLTLAILLAIESPTIAADGLAYLSTHHDCTAGVHCLTSEQQLALSSDGT